MSVPRLTVIHLARKPLSGTVAATCLKYGTGAINVDGTRIGTSGPIRPLHLPHVRAKSLTGDTRSGASLGMFAPGKTYWPDANDKGRWPANLILQHSDGCKLVGTHREDFLIQQYIESANYSFYTESDEAKPAVEAVAAGQEVEDWACVDGCPCLDLDGQSGVSHGTGGNTSGGSALGLFSGWNAHNNRPTGIARHNDTGGASRYFKQGKTMSDLHEYLLTLISPPNPFGQAMLLTVWPEGAETWAKGSCTGFVIHGFTPTDAQTKILYDLLSPGGHICLVAPDDQPTGHTGAIRLEDAGFEIRDAILWVRGSGRLHYVAKAARKEREAGCSKLPAKKGFEVVERNEGSAGVANPRAGAGGLADKIHNFHPTVKSVGIMTALLRDVPKDQGPVLDPFLGSGTTMVACLQTGHSGVGIERDAEYMAIADARVRHWNRVPMGFKGSATVICAKGQQEEVQEEVREEISIFDLASW